MAEAETWDMWYPEAGAEGLPFARGCLAPAEVLLVHAAPDVLRVEVRDAAGEVLARGDGLRREGPYIPMTVLRREGCRVLREDCWPGEGEIGRPVMLPGGETGILRSWWNAPDQRAWRWTVEFSNQA